MALTYHIPRVLQWLAEGRWHWIHTPVERMNYSGCDFEWLSAPLLLFTKSDRALFLLNFIPFLLLPGLVFSVFTRLGVRARVAWQWMWLLPTGYIFLLQAGSAGNDAFSTVYALAAIDFGCRAWASRRPRDLWLSLLAAALLTGTKPVSLPLLLPWLILIFPLLPCCGAMAATTLLVLALAAVVSFFPIAVMNQHYSGDWLGTPWRTSGSRCNIPGRHLGQWVSTVAGQFCAAAFSGGRLVEPACPGIHPHSCVRRRKFSDDGFFRWANCRPRIGRAWFRLQRAAGGFRDRKFQTRPGSAVISPAGCIVGMNVAATRAPVHSRRNSPAGFDCAVARLAGVLRQSRNGRRRRGWLRPTIRCCCRCCSRARASRKSSAAHGGARSPAAFYFWPWSFWCCRRTARCGRPKPFCPVSPRGIRINI